MMQYSMPFLFLFIVDAFRAMDPSLEEASRMCGASRWRTFRTVTLLLMLPALTGASILSFIRGIENFESPLFFGTPAGIHVITTEIYNSINQRSPPQYQYATAHQLRHHGADVPARAAAMAAVARPQLPDRDRQGLFAGGHEARADGAG